MKLKLKLIIGLGALGLGLWAGLAADAQTNAPVAVAGAVAPTPTVPEQVPLTKVAADVGTLLADFGVHFTVTGILQVLAMGFFGARFLLKYTPAAQVKGLGTALSHVALNLPPGGAAGAVSDLVKELKPPVVGLILGGLLLLTGAGCVKSGGAAPGAAGAPAVLSLNTNSGIVSVLGQPIDTNEVATAVRVTTSLGVTAAVAADTNSVAYFQAAKVVLAVAINAGEYNPTNLAASLNTISIKELRDSALAKAAVGGGLQIYQAFFGQLVTGQIDNASPYLAPALGALLAGIESVVPN